MVGLDIKLSGAPVLVLSKVLDVFKITNGD